MSPRGLEQIALNGLDEEGGIPTSPGTLLPFHPNIYRIDSFREPILLGPENPGGSRRCHGAERIVTCLVKNYLWAECANNKMERTEKLLYLNRGYTSGREEV